MSSALPNSLSINSHDHDPVRDKENQNPDSTIASSAEPGTQDGSIRRTSSSSRKACFRFRKTGNCRFGSSCKFWHGEPSVKETGDAQKQSNSQRAKLEACFSFSKRGHCRFGEKCRFVHRGEKSDIATSSKDEVLNGGSSDDVNHGEAGALEASAKRRDVVNTKSGLDATGGSKPEDGSIKVSKEGPVEMGTSGQLQTTKANRSRVCRYYRRGSCKNGTACSFAHPNVSNPKAGKAPNGDKPLSKPAPSTNGESNHPPRPKIQVQTFLRLAELTDDDLVRLRETEIKQLRQRFPDLLEMENDGQPSVYRIIAHPTDPDWPYDLQDFHLNVSFPFGYPAVKPDVDLPEDQDIPAVVLRHLTTCVQEWLQAKHEMNSMAGRVELIFRPFLRWFDRNLESKFTEGAREFKRKVEVQKSGFAFIPNKRDSPEEEEPTQPSLPEDAVVISKPKGQQWSDGLDFPKLPLDWSETRSSEEENADGTETEIQYWRDNTRTSTKEMAVIYDPPDKDMRGTEVILQGLKMSESVATLAVVKLTITVHCARCRESTDLTTPPRRNNLILCRKCNNRQIVTYRPCLVHPLSHVVGFLDLAGCLPFDVNLVTSTLLVGCLSCSHDNTLKGIQYGQTRNLWCEKCHQKMTVQAESCRFQRLQPAENIGSGRLFNVPVKGPKKQPKDPAIVDMQPLPDNGSCKHYKKSFRWLRFPCCGKFYPCDECHNLDNLVDHEMKFATRMLCGFCAKEQPYSADKPCVRCGSATTKGRTKHWEGGTGCRNRTKMSRNDKQKFAGTNKTISKKAQNKAESSKKGKSS